MAHKLARILWHLLKFKQPFNPEISATKKKKCAAKNSPDYKIQPLPSVTACFSGGTGS